MASRSAYHEERFPPPRLSGRYGFAKRSLAAITGLLGFWVRFVWVEAILAAAAPGPVQIDAEARPVAAGAQNGLGHQRAD
jgi:hypothetical protein